MQCVSIHIERGLFLADINNINFLNFYQMIEKFSNLQPDEQYDYLFDIPSGKTNPFVKLTEEDKSLGVKILCKEPYAQEMYDILSNRVKTTQIKSKDLNTGQTYTVRLVNFKKSEKLVECVEINSGAPIYIPQNEFDFTLDMSSDEDFVVLTTKIRNGAMYGSLKKCKGIIFKKRLEENMASTTPFKVKIDRLIRGGFIATYGDCVECFLPGAHAAPNVIYDFESYVGKEIDVLIDNYDKTSNYYVVSHKKYIKHVLPTNIHNLEFGKKYTGILTSDPTKFGMFVEFENIFTGLIHIAEFDNYESESKKFKTGDSIDFYITRISTKDGENFKINLTTRPEKIDETTQLWMGYKKTLEGNVFNYRYDKDSSTLEMLDDNDDVVFDIYLDEEVIAPYLKISDKLQVTRVDIIDKNASFNLLQ